MDLYTAARQFPEMSVTIRLGDLLRANEILARNIREEAQAGYLVPVRLGVKVHYRRSDIDRIIKSKEKK